jgi:hypothetical protein
MRKTFISSTFKYTKKNLKLKQIKKKNTERPHKEKKRAKTHADKF